MGQDQEKWDQEQLYRQHNPQKLQEIDQLAGKYGEAKLLKMIQKKYGVLEPAASPSRIVTKTIAVPRGAKGFGMVIAKSGEVTRVTASITAQVGVEMGAMITAVAGQPVSGKPEIVRLIKTMPPGPVEFTFQSVKERAEEPEPAEELEDSDDSEPEEAKTEPEPEP